MPIDGTGFDWRDGGDSIGEPVVTCRFIATGVINGWAKTVAFAAGEFSPRAELLSNGTTVTSTVYDVNRCNGKICVSCFSFHFQYHLTCECRRNRTNYGCRKRKDLLSSRLFTVVWRPRVAGTWWKFKFVMINRFSIGEKVCVQK